MTASSSAGNRYARFIPSEEIEQVAPWEFGAVDESVRAALAAAAQLEAEHGAENTPAALARLQQVREEARAEGHAAGYAEATREGNERLDAYVAGQGHAAAEQLAQLVSSAQQGLDAAQQRIAQGVLDMACALARQVLRHELSLNPNALQPVIREALGTLLADGRPATVRLHAQDLDMLRAPLQDEFGSIPVQWLADAAVPPGGCLVESAGTVIDGRLQTRWDRAIAALGLEAPWEEPAAQPPSDAEQADG
ncbi:flagellar assembly protein FliH [Xylophilus sp. ASV27]|uniref:flagellar assembly protein FliH n=1 Tax=Xylophilus sp. ASV27 TaxID=2795129 RepID=UPI0018ECD536|nr:flagellar assembly protein FliH [Xylophilus sp. ASV27]